MPGMKKKVTDLTASEMIAQFKSETSIFKLGSSRPGCMQMIIDEMILLEDNQKSSSSQLTTLFRSKQSSRPALTIEGKIENLKRLESILEGTKAVLSSLEQENKITPAHHAKYMSEIRDIESWRSAQIKKLEVALSSKKQPVAETEMPASRQIMGKP